MLGWNGSTVASANMKKIWAASRYIALRSPFGPLHRALHESGKRSSPSRPSGSDRRQDYAEPIFEVDFGGQRVGLSTSRRAADAVKDRLMCRGYTGNHVRHLVRFRSIRRFESLLADVNAARGEFLPRSTMAMRARRAREPRDRDALSGLALREWARKPTWVRSPAEEMSVGVAGVVARQVISVRASAPGSDGPAEKGPANGPRNPGAVRAPIAPL